MTTSKRAKWFDRGIECNLCTKDAVYSGLCEECHKLPEPRTESKAWNEAIEAAAKWLEGIEECFCQNEESHEDSCMGVVNLVTAEAMRKSLLRPREVPRS
jgi:hypothetical protein